MQPFPLKEWDSEGDSEQVKKLDSRHLLSGVMFCLLSGLQREGKYVESCRRSM